MSTYPPPSVVRRIVIRTLGTLGVAVSEPDLEERIKVRDGKYVARSYRADQFMAMWLIEYGVVQFYDSDGAMVLMVNLFDDPMPLRAAA
jgi:hypothetical protein